MKKQFILAFAMVAGLSLTAEAKASKQKTIDLTVTEKGFEPKSVDVKPGTDVTLNVTRKTDITCAKQVQVPSKNIKVDLPLNQPVKVALGKLAKGEVRFGCGMDMMEAATINAK